MRLNLPNFGGILPKNPPHLLSGNFAEIAEDVDLSRGTIQAWYKPLKVSEQTGDSIHIHDCCVLVGNCESRFVDYGLHHQQLVVATGIKPYPVYTTECPPNWKRLGFDCELIAPKVQAPFVNIDFSVEQVSYYYTLINELGWESAPSYPSEWISVDAKDKIKITGFSLSEEAVSIRIYRAQSPLRFGVEKDDNDEAVFLLVGEIPATQPLFIDDTLIAGEANSSEYDYPPPSDLKELNVWQQGYLAGISEGDFVMSANNKPYAWHNRFRVRLTRKAKALCCAGGYAYLLGDSMPTVLIWRGDCEGELPFSIQEIPANLPVISRRSVDKHLDSVVYASYAGLVMIQGNQAVVITKDHYTERQWSQLLPHTMRGVVHHGVYYGASDNAFIRFDLPDSIFSTPNETALTTLSLRPKALTVSQQGRLFMALDDGVFEWNSSHERMPYHWKSKVHDVSGRTKLSAFKLKTNGMIEVSHWVDSGLIQTEMVGREVTRLPLGYSGHDWQVSFKGTSEITQYDLASSVREL